MTIHNAFTFKSVPKYSFDFDQIVHITKASKSCKYHIIYASNLESLENIDFDKMTLNFGAFAIIFDQGVHPTEIVSLFEDKKSIVFHILNVAVFLKVKHSRYLTFTRSVQDEVSLVIRAFSLKKSLDFKLYSTERHRNMNMKNIYASSFNFPPFTYENGDRFQGYEVSIIQIC